MQNKTHLHVMACVDASSVVSWGRRHSQRGEGVVWSEEVLRLTVRTRQDSQFVAFFVLLQADDTDI